MKTYLLTWNPHLYPWKGLRRSISDIKKSGAHRGNWSCRTYQIIPGDRVFLLRQGEEPRGIVASGLARSTTYEGKHWDTQQPKATTTYVEVEFDVIIDPKSLGVLPTKDLTGRYLSQVHWNTQSSGIEIPASAARILEIKWREFLSKIRVATTPFPEELDPKSDFFEGASRTVLVNAFERNSQARKECIARHGATCAVCKFEFGKFYGDIGEGYIHVHHCVPISQVGKQYKVDPLRDPIPVCPNCHAMLHIGKDLLDYKQLRRIIQKRQRRAGTE